MKKVLIALAAVALIAAATSCKCNNNAPAPPVNDKEVAAVGDKGASLVSSKQKKATDIKETEVQNPLEQFIKLFEETCMIAVKAQKLLDEGKNEEATNLAQEIKSKADELQKVFDENKNYKLTDRDREALKACMKRVGKQVGDEPSEKEIEDVDHYITLGDINL
ncbi:MAG: hypothetical protein IK008_07420 [Bacteroidales bacterium]|nr:hypothetical protein [Bacteroidales bacterium]